MAGPTPLDHFAIQNTIARYCIALDTKNFDLFSDVFTADVAADYPFTDRLQGIPAIAKAIQARLTHITSQHALTTQMIEAAPSGTTAKATTYFTGLHFGKGKWEGKELTAWGKYEDELVLDQGGEASGDGLYRKWLINRRVVHFMGRQGEEGVMQGE